MSHLKAAQSSGKWVDREAGEFVCEFISRLPNTDTGKPFQLQDWQRKNLMEFYGSMELDEATGEALRQYWYLYLEIPKEALIKASKKQTKSGKRR